MNTRTAFTLLFALTYSCAFCHGGRTDANGGHMNNKTGQYEIHSPVARPTAASHRPASRHETVGFEIPRFERRETPEMVRFSKLIIPEALIIKARGDLMYLQGLGYSGPTLDMGTVEEKSLDTGEYISIGMDVEARSVMLRKEAPNFAVNLPSMLSKNVLQCPAAKRQNPRKR